MQRITITLEDALLAELDDVMARSGATNRSEALRDLLRRALAPAAPAAAECLAVVTCTIDPTIRDLARHVPRTRHAHHDRTIAAMSVPVDHDTALDVSVMRGAVADIDRFANTLFLERGVRHGTVALIPVETRIETHHHGDGHGAGTEHRHAHLRVLDRFPADFGSEDHALRKTTD
jgi:CopG family nickel-responsive transcriptional regulator